MPHPRTKLMADFGVNRHDIADRSWPGFKKLVDTSADMFRHNYHLFRQLQIAGALSCHLGTLLDEWRHQSGRIQWSERPDSDLIVLDEESRPPMDPGRMIDQLTEILDNYMGVDPKDLLKDECHCPPGYTCPHCEHEKILELEKKVFRLNLYARGCSDSVVEARTAEKFSKPTQEEPDADTEVCDADHPGV